MKKEITDKKRIKEFQDKQKRLCVKCNMFPMIEVNLETNQVEYFYFELDKMTKEEKMGQFLEGLPKKTKI